MGLFSCFSRQAASCASPASMALAPVLSKTGERAGHKRVQFAEDDVHQVDKAGSPVAAKGTSPQSRDSGFIAKHSVCREHDVDVGVAITRALDQKSAKTTRPSNPSGVHTPLSETTCISGSPVCSVSSKPGKPLPATQGLVKRAAGLGRAHSGQPDVSDIAGAAHLLIKIASSTVVNGENAAMLALLGQDVIRSLDLAGKKGSVLQTVALEDLLAHLHDSCDMVEVFAEQGWLLHMAFNGHVKADFDNHHNAIVEALQVAGLEVPGKSSPLPRGVYLDANRNLRRCLKRIGGGSVAQGLTDVSRKQLTNDIVELANLLGVSPEAVSKELAALPANVPADAYYSRMVVLQSSKGAPSDMQRFKPIFDRYDKGGRGYLNRSSLHAVMADMGALEGKRPVEIEAAVSLAFSLADHDCDGRISPEEFARYYDTMTYSDAPKQLRMELGLDVEDELKQFFNDFCTFGTRQVVEEIDGGQFVKLFRDCKLPDKVLTVAEIELVFAGAKPKGSRKLSFDGFVAALAECAARKGVTLDGLVRTILACHGPIARGTKADSVRLHDDRSAYTGVYAKGGPKVAGRGNDLATMLDRSDTRKIVARVSRPTAVTIVEKPAEKVQQLLPVLSSSMHLPNGSTGFSGAWRRRSIAGGQLSAGNISALHEMWLLWAQFGAGSAPSQAAASTRSEMGVQQFIKMMRDTGLLDRTFTSVQVELIFLRVRAKGSIKLSFEAFEKALLLVAEAKGVAGEDVVNSILESQGPMLTNSKP